jgi:hypothetical protein
MQAAPIFAPCRAVQSRKMAHVDKLAFGAEFFHRLVKVELGTIRGIPEDFVDPFAIRTSIPHVHPLSVDRKTL